MRLSAVASYPKRFALVASAAATLLVGCSSGVGALGISGVVKDRGGAPVSSDHAQVIFTPTTPGGQSVTATLNDDGTFTAAPGSDGRGGAHPGEYKVVVQAHQSYRDLTLTSPPEYADAATTPLTATVDDDHTHFEFTLE